MRLVILADTLERVIVLDVDLGRDVVETAILSCLLDIVPVSLVDLLWSKR